MSSLSAWRASAFPAIASSALHCLFSLLSLLMLLPSLSIWFDRDPQCVLCVLCTNKKRVKQRENDLRLRITQVRGFRRLVRGFTDWVRRWVRGWSLASCGFCFDLLFVFLLFLWLSWNFFQREKRKKKKKRLRLRLIGFRLWNSGFKTQLPGEFSLKSSLLPLIR